jgi:hypothetical protein
MAALGSRLIVGEAVLAPPPSQGPLHHGSFLPQSRKGGWLCPPSKMGITKLRNLEGDILLPYCRD